METLWQDVRYGIRSLVKSPAFSLVVVLTLALGIGANTAVFSVVNSLMLRPLPVPNPEELVVLAVKHEGNMDPHQVSIPDFQDYRKNTEVFSDMTGYLINFVGVSDGQRADRAAISFVASNYFTLLGVEPYLGRMIQPGEGETPGTEPVMVLGYRYWQKRFGADPGVVGKLVHVNGQAYTIIGVVPETFHGAYTLVEFDAYIPLGMSSLDASYKDHWTRRDEHSLRVLARLKPGVTIEQAEARLGVTARQLQEQYPATNKTVTIHVYPENLSRPEPNSAQQNPIVATLFLSLTGLVLLVACVNVANLLLVRATLRQKELAVRAALGAGKMRLVRQLLTESVLLALGGGVAGAVLGVWVSRLLESVRLPGDLPFRFDFAFDWRAFAYVTALAGAAGIIVGLLPALRASRTNLNDTLRGGGRALSGGAGRHRIRNVLVVAQVAVSLVLLVAAGLFIRSLGNAQSADLGFNPRGVLNMTMDPGLVGYDDQRARNFYRELEPRIRALPGVETVSLGYSVPFGYFNLGEYLNVEGQEVTEETRRPVAGYNLVGPEYFKTMGIPLVAGRVFTEQDNADSHRVAIINQVMARKLWPDQDPIGKRFSMTGAQGPYIEVVGVARDSRTQWIFEDISSYFYLPMEQAFRSLHTVQVRTSVPPASLALAIQKEVRALDANLPVYDVMTMSEALNGGNGLFLINMGALFAGALGMLGLALAIVGVYGVVSYAASQRTHEIGVRLALGAQRGHILKLVVGQGLLLVSAGLVVGLFLSVWLARAMANFLFDLSPYDPVTFAGVSALLAVVALVACWIPAQRATHVDPVIALRYE